MSIQKFSLSALAVGLMAMATSTVASAQTRYDWSGVYVGANLGASMNTVDWSYYNNPTQTVSRDYRAFAYGMQAGAQLQMGQLVLGAEFGLNGNRGSSTGPDAPAFAANFDTRAQVKSILTVGPRIGWAFNNWMVYGTGGYAQTSTESSFFIRATPSTNDIRTSTVNGWFAGGGVEVALSKNWIAGLEYRHIEAEQKLVGPVVPLLNVSRYVDTSVDEVKARLSFKLGQ